MIIIENSNIVNWGEYPEYICAVVMQTTKDLVTKNGFVCPIGEEITCLLDKSPKIIGDDIEINSAKINYLGGIGFIGNGDIPADIKEIHYKPRPKVNIELKKEIEIKEM